MTNLERLLFGMQHIAENHGFKADVDYEENGYQVCVYGGCNVPTLCDVKMLCGDVHIDTFECVSTSDFGIDVTFSRDWWENWASEEYDVDEDEELWRKVS